MGKLSTGLLIIGITIALLIGSTFVLFSDSELGIGNAFATETLDLKIHHEYYWEKPFESGVTGTWTLSNMKPGDETGVKFITFKNFGSIGANHLEINSSYTIDEGDDIESETNYGNTADEMAEEMIITQMRYYDEPPYSWKIDLLTDDDYDLDYGTGDGGLKVSDLNGDGKVSLYELQAQGGIEVRPPDEKTRLKMKIKFDEGAGNEYQGDELTVTFIFTLR